MFVKKTFPVFEIKNLNLISLCYSPVSMGALKKFSPFGLANGQAIANKQTNIHEWIALLYR